MKAEGLAIYLTREDIPPAKMEMLSHVELADQPCISLPDIISYHAQTHELKLTEAAFERITRLGIPVSGKSFLVCVDKSPIYWGAFWTPFSSLSFDGVTIWIPPVNQDAKTITIELGYPSVSFYAGTDPRNDSKVMESLKQSGKLVS
jgi:hypothetical protein